MWTSEGAGLVGLTSKRDDGRRAGTSSWSSSSCFGTSSAPKKVMPVTLPSGRFRLATSPVVDRVASCCEDNRNRGIQLLAATVGVLPAMTITATGRPISSAAISASGRCDCPPIGTRSLHSALDITCFLRPWCNAISYVRESAAHCKQPDHRHRRLLRLRRQRPRRRTAEQRDELTASHEEFPNRPAGKYPVRSDWKLAYSKGRAGSNRAVLTTAGWSLARLRKRLAARIDSANWGEADRNAAAR